MRKTTILIVDDHPNNLLSLNALLMRSQNPKEEPPINVIQSNSGKEALRILLNQPVDLVLLDIQMPEMDGFEVARLMAESPRTRSIPIIFLTAIYGDIVHILKGYSQGAIDFILKPINPELLEAKIKNFLNFQNAVWRAASLEKEKEAALEVSKTKSLFLTNMSHELRTPMNGIIGMVDVLALSHLDKDQRECVETIKTSGLQMLHIINDILDLSKIEHNKLELDRKPVHLARLIDDVCNVYRSQVLAKNLRLEISVAPDIPLVLADPYRFRQIVTNLLGNSIKFTERGYIAVRATRAAPKAGKVVIDFAIEDSGVGISPADQTKLFKNFSQVNSSTTKRHQGAGLGLAITKNLVDLMDGEIECTSEEGKGSTFKITIPFDVPDAKRVTEEEANADSAPAPRSIAPGTPSRGVALIVDDNIVNQRVAEQMMKTLAYDYVSVANGKEAVATFEKNQNFSVILMDCLMPEMDGYEATRMIRRIEKSHTPIIAVTASALKGDDQKCRAAGMDGYISKPLQLKVLEGELVRVCLQLAS